MTNAVDNRDEQPDDSGTHLPQWRAWLPRFVWAGASIVFLAWIVLGTIEARIWMSGRLTFTRRGVAHVWRYFGDRLPEMPGGPLFPFLYYFSLVVMAVGTVVGIGLFLLTDDDAAPSLERESTPSSTSATVND